MKNSAAKKLRQVPEGYLVIGVDAHKKKHAAAVVTQDFNTHSKFKFNNSREGFEIALQRAKMEMMRDKLRSKEGREIYKKRAYTVEPVIGHIKWNRRKPMMSLRGLEKIRGEFSLMCLVHNVKKIVKQVLEGSVPCFSLYKAPRLSVLGHRIEEGTLVRVQV